MGAGVSSGSRGCIINDRGNEGMKKAKGRPRLQGSRAAACRLARSGSFFRRFIGLWARGLLSGSFCCFQRLLWVVVWGVFFLQGPFGGGKGSDSGAHCCFRGRCVRVYVFQNKLSCRVGMDRCCVRARWVGHVKSAGDDGSLVARKQATRLGCSKPAAQLGRARDRPKRVRGWGGAAGAAMGRGGRGAGGETDAEQSVMERSARQQQGGQSA
jgi:hypothetical protein